MPISKAKVPLVQWSICHFELIMYYYYHQHFTEDTVIFLVVVENLPESDKMLLTLSDLSKIRMNEFLLCECYFMYQLG